MHLKPDYCSLFFNFFFITFPTCAKVGIAFPSEWVAKTMQINAASTSEGLCENREALEAEFRAAITTHHLVAFRFLSKLGLDVLFAHRHLASWALFGARLLHPTLQQCLVIWTARSDTFALLLSVLVTGETFVEWLNATTDARHFLAQWAFKMP